MSSENQAPPVIQETINIENFLSIKKASFPIKRINLIIGEQTKGKSVVIKLVFLFRHFLQELLREIVTNSDAYNVKFAKNAFENKFIKIFPKEIWSQSEFTIEYQFNDLKIRISHQLGDENLRLTSKVLDNAIRTLVDELHEQESKNKENSIEDLSSADKSPWSRINYLRYFIDSKTDFSSFKSIIKSDYDNCFVPFNRSLCSLLANNSLSVLNAIETRTFGFFLENYLSEVQLLIGLNKRIPAKVNENSVYKSLSQDLLHGSYDFAEPNKVNLIDRSLGKIEAPFSSSSQQDLWSLLLILERCFAEEKYINYNLYIEEPELNLYPASQEKLVNLIIASLKNKAQSVFLTTHSPYVLNTISNNLKAGSMVQHDRNIKKKVSEIIAEDFQINPEDISAFQIVDGELDPIIDENGEIAAKKFDMSAHQIFDKYDQMIMLQYD